MARSSDNNQAPADDCLTVRRFGLDAGLAVLAAISLVAILAERPLLETTRVLDADDGRVAHYSDELNGGDSTSEINDPQAMSWRCNLVEKARFLFCGFELIVAPDRQAGIDLRNYDRIKLWMDYEGPTETIRVYLRNFDPVYSKPGVNDSTKYNQVEFESDLARRGQPVEFDMADFFVANWWLQHYRISPVMAHPQFDNVVVLEVQSGSNPQVGEHRFRLEKIELTGQVLTTQQWYQGIVGGWLLVALAFLGNRTVTLKRELKRKSQRERELVEINSVLDRHSRELEEKAKTDPLTGAFNREGIEAALQLGLAERRRQDRPLSLIMLDVDNFKQVNDTYGHAMGDRILSGLSTRVQDNIRASDLFSRWGGEEFVLVCRDTGLNDAACLAEKLRRLIEAETFGESVAVSASFGVATLGAGESLDQIFGRVDRALYAAKANGRNRVEIAC